MCVCVYVCVYLGDCVQHLPIIRYLHEYYFCAYIMISNNMKLRLTAALVWTTADLFPAKWGSTRGWSCAAFSSATTSSGFVLS